jgi:hypothetical protein
MDYKDYAKSEFKLSGWSDENGKFKCKMQEALCLNILELLDKFSKQEHSGTTAPYVLGLFNQLAQFRPITPLTGEDSEWNEVGTDMWQNKRYSSVFKGADGKAYDIDAKVFREPDGSCYTKACQRIYIEFPYTPKKEYVDVEKS